MADRNGTVSVRYLVDDVDQAIDFYTQHFGFEPGHNASPRSPRYPGATCGCCCYDVTPSLGRPRPRHGDGETRATGRNTA